jgi:natural product precursor
MKKPMKKLSLAKETVRSLEERELTAAVGGTAPSYDFICKRPSVHC